MPTTHYWLASVNSCGAAYELIDGPHDSRKAVEKAAYLCQQLGLLNGVEVYCLRVTQTPVVAKPHGADPAVVAACRDVIDALR